MKKVLITGATGFIGSWVAKELLSHNVEVIAVVRENSNNLEKLSKLDIRIVPCNLDNLSSLPKMIMDKNIDTVYHFGWQGVSDADIKDANIQIGNVRATLELINSLPQIGCNTFIGAGSLHEIEAFYDMQENKVINNLGYMYKAAKVAAHWMGKAKAGAEGIRFFWPIISNTYGAGEKSGRLINSVIRNIIQGKVPELSAGRQNYDFVYISDVAKAFYLIGEKGVSGSNYFIGSGDAKPLREYMDIVGEVTNRMNSSNVEMGYGKISSDVVYLPLDVFNIEKLRNDTGYTIEVPFEEGIQRTVEWIMNNS